jgi:hypothetical protein
MFGEVFHGDYNCCDNFRQAAAIGRSPGAFWQRDLSFQELNVTGAGSGESEITPIVSMKRSFGQTTLSA